jgi:hypothetical protein
MGISRFNERDAFATAQTLLELRRTRNVAEQQPHQPGLMVAAKHLDLGVALECALGGPSWEEPAGASAKESRILRACSAGGEVIAVSSVQQYSRKR